VVNLALLQVELFSIRFFCGRRDRRSAVRYPDILVLHCSQGETTMEVVDVPGMPGKFEVLFNGEELACRSDVRSLLASLFDLSK
jgi:hypothetical protein